MKAKALAGLLAAGLVLAGARGAAAYTVELSLENTTNRPVVAVIRETDPRGDAEHTIPPGARIAIRNSGIEGVRFAPSDVWSMKSCEVHVSIFADSGRIWFYHDATHADWNDRRCGCNGSESDTMAHDSAAGDTISVACSLESIR